MKAVSEALIYGTLHGIVGCRCAVAAVQTHEVMPGRDFCGRCALWVS